MEQGLRGTDLTRRRLTCEKARVKAEMEKEQSKRDRARERKRKQRDTASKESKAKQKESDRLRKKDVHRESLVETRTTLCSLSETLQMTALPIFSTLPRPHHLAPTCYTWLQRISTCIFPDILLREAYSAHVYS